MNDLLPAGEPPFRLRPRQSRILPLREGRVSFEQLSGRPCSPTSHESPAAPDQILVLPLPDGGLITYLKPAGHLLHTLNTPEGFIRKLRQLGLTDYGKPSGD